MKTVNAESDNGNSMERIQYPLRLTFAVTIHKCQSLTLNLAKVDIGQHEKTTGLTYVAFSRVRRLEDLLLVPFSLPRLQQIKQYTETHDKQTQRLVAETIAEYHKVSLEIYF